MLKNIIFYLSSFLFLCTTAFAQCIDDIPEDPGAGKWQWNKSRICQNYSDFSFNQGGFTFHHSIQDLGSAGYFHLLGSSFRSPDTPHFVDKIRFLIFTKYAKTDFSDLLPPGARVGVIFASEGAYDLFPVRESTGSDIIATNEFDVNASMVVTDSNSVDLDETHVRISTSPNINTHRYLRFAPPFENYGNGYFLRVEVKLATPVRLPSSTDLRIVPFLKNWDFSNQDVGILLTKTFTDSNVHDQSDQFFRPASTNVPDLLQSYTCPGGLCKGVREVDFTSYGYPELRMALDFHLRPVQIGVDPRSRKISIPGGHCVFLEGSSDLQNWSEPQQLTDATRSVYDFPAEAGGLYFWRLTETDESNFKSADCLSPALP